MDRRQTVHNPYIAPNPYLHSNLLGRRYGKSGSSSWVLWSEPPPRPNNPCSILNVLIIFLVILGVIAVAGLAFYIGALRMEPIQAYLIFDGSMRVLGDKYNPNLGNKSASEFHDKIRRYQTLLEAVYSKSLLGPSLQEVIVNSFGNGSLIIFFRIILDRRKIPKPISNIEETAKNVILQEASSPLSVMSTLKVDPKQLFIRRYLEDMKGSSLEDEINSVLVVDSTPVTRSTVQYTASTTDSPETTQIVVKNTSKKPPRGSYSVTTISDGRRKPPILISTTSSSTEKDVRTTIEPGSLLMGMKHSPILKQYLQHNKEHTTSGTTSTTSTTTTTTTTVKPSSTTTSTESNLRITLLPTPQYADEPWKPILPKVVTPSGQRNLSGTVDFDYGIGEAEAVIDQSTEVKVSPGEKKHFKIPSNDFRGPLVGVFTPSKTETTTGKVVKLDTPPDHTRENDRMKQFELEANQQKSLPGLSILEQFHSLDSLLRSFTSKKPTAPSTTSEPETKGTTTVVTLLPPRSNVGFRGPLRPRPLVPPRSTDIRYDLTLAHPTSDETTSSPGKKLVSELVAIPLQHHFLQQDSISPVVDSDDETERMKSFVVENLKEIAVITTDKSRKMTEAPVSYRELKMSDPPINYREPKTRKKRSRPLDKEMRLLLEEIFQNLTTTSRTVSGTNISSQTIDFHVSLVAETKPRFDLNATHQLLNKLAKLRISGEVSEDLKSDTNNESQLNSDSKLSNKAVSHASNDNFNLLTKVLNKAPSKPQEITDKPLPVVNEKECAVNKSLRCGSGECIAEHSRCNKLVDCHDGSDEKNCTCAESLKAQSLHRHICDGILDCSDSSDEHNCEWCSAGQYVCRNSRLCIDQSQLCDGFPHCPYGDDERHCITLAPSSEMTTSDDITYHPTGTLMVRKEGEWGKMCFQNFENVVSKSKLDWSIMDLGQSVCKTLTFSNFDGISRMKDKSYRKSLKSPAYFELIYSPDSNDTLLGKSSSRERLIFEKTACLEKEVAEVHCSGLECGVRPENSIPWASGERRSRIVGGDNALPGSWPWQAALYKEGEFQCGGTLISASWLISAAHCFYQALDEWWVARVGGVRRGGGSPLEQSRPVASIVLHPRYQDTGFINDLALLRLTQPLALTPHVRPICLPLAPPPPTGTLCTVVGWGQLFEVGRVFPETLQEVELPVISTGECRKRTVFLPLYRITDDMLCAGYDRGGRDACLGDSGGPLMCQEGDSHWTLVGVTSNGYGCARANRPGVYTKVWNYMEWMREVMRRSEPSLTSRKRRGCPGHRCPLGHCLPPASICNGFIECSDASDERGCW